MPEHQYSCLYDSQSDKTGNKWTLFNDAGLSTHPSSIVLSKEGKDGMIFKLKATGKEFVGINIPISRLVGIIELEYLAIGAKNGGLENLIFSFNPSETQFLKSNWLH
ncbi:MAG: hypothetical protein IPK21_22815 [Haliscomenobacter sp.]|nr:hypothetical protein [Haliscomenobacter sp.]